MNQCANARAASLERCKRMAQSPLPPLHSLSPSCCLDLLHFPPWLPFFSHSLVFPPLTATYLSYSPSPLCSHSTSLWHIYSFLSLFYSIILPLSCYLICSFHSLFISFCDPPHCIALVGAIISIFCLPAPTVLSLSSPQLFILLLLFSKRGKEREKKVCGKKRESLREMKIEERKKS